MVRPISLPSLALAASLFAASSVAQSPDVWHTSTTKAASTSSSSAAAAASPFNPGPLSPEEIIVNSGRPTFFTDPNQSITGKIVLEEHVGTDLFNPAFTTPFFNNTNELPFGQDIYENDVKARLAPNAIGARVQQMDASNISVSILSLSPPGVQGILNRTFAVQAAAYVNNQIYNTYIKSNYSDRFAFFCTVALQDVDSAVTELKRCVKELGGVGVFFGGYTNLPSADGNAISYLDDPMNEPFWKALSELNVPLYLHPRMPAPNQQRVYQGWEFLGGSPWGFATETAAHALRLMVSGLFDRYPNLQIVLGHCGEGIPFTLARIDARLRHFQHQLWPATQTMTTYWENNFYVTTAGVFDSPTIMDTMRVIGEDRVLFSVDYPFEDDVEISSWFDRLEMSSNTKKKIAYGNAYRIFKLPGTPGKQ